MSIKYTNSWLGYENKSYSLSYKDLKESHQLACMETDENFLNELPKMIHLACVLCWFKEISTDICLCDDGVIHSLAHLMHLKDERIVNKDEVGRVRKIFEEQLKLQ